MVIGGSTASGKSALALELARRIDGIVVNADSQQLFVDLPKLTARPTAAETAAVPHRLYGALAATEQPSVGRWLHLVAEAWAEARRLGRTAVVTGGSGLYLHALLHGLPAMPEIPAGLRAELRAFARTAPPERLHDRLAARDPRMAARLHPTDPQRVLRALEGVEASGRSLLAWQADPRQRLPLPARLAGFALVPPAAVVNARIEARLRGMIAGGVLAEVQELMARRPDATSLPIAKVHGLRELAQVCRKELALEPASRSIAAQTRQYAKRQRTWFRHQLPELQPIEGSGDGGDAIGLILARLGTR